MVVMDLPGDPTDYQLSIDDPPCLHPVKECRRENLSSGLEKEVQSKQEEVELAVGDGGKNRNI